MTQTRIIRFRLRPQTTWESVLSELQPSLLDASLTGAAVEDVQLLRMGTAEGVLVLSGADETALERLASDVIEPWLEANDLGDRAPAVGGEVLFSLRRHRADQYEALNSLEDAARIEFFVERVLESETVWGLYGVSWARSSAAGGAEALPFWTHRDHAAACVRGQWSAFAPRSVELDEFAEQWLPSMHEDRISAVVVPTPLHEGAVVAAAALGEALRTAEELEDRDGRLR